MGRLDGKVAIVTGAGSQTEGIGNGRAAAILFAREGAKVLLVDRVAERAEETAHQLQAEGLQDTGAVFQADVTDAAQCRAMVEEAVGRWGKLDILQNNVGIGARAGTILDMDDAVWERMMRVNVTGMMLAAKAAIPAMKANGGAIVNISSIAAWLPRGLTAYATSKGAVEALTRGLAADHARDRIRVNCIEPGPVFTPMVQVAGMTDELREARRRASPLGLEGTAWDIAYASLYLASGEARYVTGVVLPVDGGVLLTSR
ncbi:MAG: SDR family oxidoreductase [Chloroflexi bacterium]|nr:SDR family oxidoreductase [Chloroflexota bacterium]